MPNTIGLRLEDKNVWERRVALTPAHVAALTEQGCPIHVERFPRRAYPDQAYAEAGAVLADDVSGADLVVGIKEMPVDAFRPGGAYLFFSHTIKGQSYNMGMLAKLVELGCTLLDYEVVTDEAGRRLIFFGRYAGLAGMVDTLWTLGKRLEVLGHDTPLVTLQPTHAYDGLDEVREAVVQVGRRILDEGLPDALTPLVFGFTGYGNVSRGAQEILDLLPHLEVAPGDLADFVRDNPGLRDRVVKVVYQEQDLVEPIDPSQDFDLQDYYDHGSARYRSRFEPHLSLLSVLVNAIYWDEKYPKLADADQLRELFAGSPRLLAVGDITCDVDGSLACTVRDTDPGDPVFVFDPATRSAPLGFEGPGLAVMAVGNLPCELPREASWTFGEALTPFVPALCRADLAADFDDVELPDPIRRSVILWRGQFTPPFRYMREFLG